MAPLTIRVEDTNEDIILDLEEHQIDRAQQDSEYVSQLVAQYYQHQDPSSAERESQGLDLEQQHTLTEDREDSESSLFIWKDAGILLLLTLYEEHKEDMSRKRHKVVYQNIARKMLEINPVYQLSGGQCQSKINSLKKHYKKIKDHNNKSGNSRVTWPYYEKMEEIFGSTGWAQPVAVASNEGPSTTEVISNKVEQKKRKLDTIIEKYSVERNIHRKEKIAKQQENFDKFLMLKKQQHDEKMAMLKHLCNLYCNNNN